MFRWLAGPGSVFREPLPGSTNYLSAYNKEGQLRRDVRSSKSDGADSDSAPKLSASEGGDELPTELDEAATKATGSSEHPPKLAEASPRDLVPFPANPHFKSQAVLDEPLREEIYRRVMKEGKSVRVVSAELGVEMRRVGAVVRLKAVEKDWSKKVSFKILLFSHCTFPLQHDETLYKSISL